MERIWNRQVMGKCAIVIPVYKVNIDEEEMISLKRIQAIYKKYDIFLVTPNGLNIDKYKKILDTVYQITFDATFFDGFIGYNKLLTSEMFYSQFIEYEYILIHQTDSLTIKDNLKTFLELNYDYIGAPIIKHKPWENRLWVGNGGFSLRRVKKCINAVKDIHDVTIIDNCNEDTFFSNYGQANPKKFKIAPVDVALKFAFDQPVAGYCYKISDYELPMGIHGWYRYDTMFCKSVFGGIVPKTYRWNNVRLFDECINKLKLFLKEQKKIYLYGAGDIGRVFATYLKRNDYCISGFIVSNDQTISISKVCDIPVFHISECDLSGAGVIVTVLQRYRGSFEFGKVLSNYNVKHSLIADENLIFAVELALITNCEEVPNSKG